MFSRLHLKRALALSLLLAGAVSAPPVKAQSVDSVSQKERENFSAVQLEDLAEPIALYPDNLLKAVLPAATYPDQIVDAALQIKSAADAKNLKSKNWDTSVKVVATYPGVLQMLYEKLDWTTDLGEAYLYQTDDLLLAIQRLRAKAKQVGNLESNQYQTVRSEKGPNGTTVLLLESKNPEVVYVPQTTTVVYEQKQDNSSWLVPLATFGLGLAVGSALSDNHDHYYYGGGYWGGGYNYWGHSHNQWVDYRRDRWKDVNNYYRDRQDFRQDRFRDAQEHHQSRQIDRQEFRQSGQTIYNDKRYRSEAGAVRARDNRASDNIARVNEQARAEARARAEQRGIQGGSLDSSSRLSSQSRTAYTSGSAGQTGNQMRDMERRNQARATAENRFEARQRAESGAGRTVYSGTAYGGGASASSGRSQISNNSAFNSAGSRASETRASQRGMASRSMGAGRVGGMSRPAAAGRRR